MTRTGDVVRVKRIVHAALLGGTLHWPGRHGKGHRVLTGSKSPITERQHERDVARAEWLARTKRTAVTEWAVANRYMTRELATIWYVENGYDPDTKQHCGRRLTLEQCYTRVPEFMDY
jgi:hypothetical protein